MSYPTPPPAYSGQQKVADSGDAPTPNEQTFQPLNFVELHDLPNYIPPYENGNLSNLQIDSTGRVFSTYPHVPGSNGCRCNCNCPSPTPIVQQPRQELIPIVGGNGGRVQFLNKNDYEDYRCRQYSISFVVIFFAIIMFIGLMMYVNQMRHFGYGYG